MKKIYLSYIYLLLTRTIFAIQLLLENPGPPNDFPLPANTQKYITIADPFTTLSLTTSQTPNTDDCTAQYINTPFLDKVQKQIIKYLENPNQPNQNPSITIYKKTKLIGKSLSKHYVSITLGPNRSPYYFSWEKKSYKGLKGVEKGIADYYKVDEKSSIEFLYPYNCLNVLPWAIKFNDQTYATIWVKAELTDLPKETSDPFLEILTNKQKDDLLSVIIDQESWIIAKRIGTETIFRK